VVQSTFPMGFTHAGAVGIYHDCGLPGSDGLGVVTNQSATTFRVWGLRCGSCGRNLSSLLSGKSTHSSCKAMNEGGEFSEVQHRFSIGLRRNEYLLRCLLIASYYCCKRRGPMLRTGFGVQDLGGDVRAVVVVLTCPTCTAQQGDPSNQEVP
jgi:hypothetical protein